MENERRYLCVIEVDVWAEDDLTAAIQAIAQFRALTSPQVHVRPIDDNLEPWQSVDFADIQENGCPYIGTAKPLCFDFIS